MELYEYACPEVMEGKKILYLHGFASSGQNGSVRTLQTLLPRTVIVAPDIPAEPEEALPFLRDLCASEKPDLVIGTSMGGMYAELLRGCDRILINPAFRLADTLLKNNGLGRHEYHNPRRDGQTSLLMTKGMLESFREVSSHCFEAVPQTDPACTEDWKLTEEQKRVFGLFGLRDNLVDTFDLFASHYPNAIRFDGEHYMNDSTLLHSVLPLIRLIDDRQEGRSRKLIHIAWEDVLADIRNNRPKGKAPLEYEPENSAVKAFRTLARHYDLHVVCNPPYNRPGQWQDAVQWAEKYLGVEAWGKVVCCRRKDLLIGDYLIDRHPELYPDFMGTALRYGEDPFRTWEDILTFFSRLGGQ